MRGNKTETCDCAAIAVEWGAMVMFSESDVDAGIEHIFGERGEGRSLELARHWAMSAFNLMVAHYSEDLANSNTAEFRKKKMRVLMTKQVLPKIEGLQENSWVAVANEVSYVTTNVDEVFLRLHRLPEGFTLIGSILSAGPISFPVTESASEAEQKPGVQEYLYSQGELSLGLEVGNVVMFSPDGEAFPQTKEVATYLPISTYTRKNLRTTFPREIVD